MKSNATQTIEELGAELVLALQQFQGSSPLANADATVSELHTQVKAALPHMQEAALNTLLIILNVVKLSVQQGLVTPQVGNDFFAMATAASSAPQNRPIKSRAANTANVASVMHFPAQTAAANRPDMVP